MLTGLRLSIERKLGEAVVERSPFPHVIVEDFFPNEIYSKIIAYNPFLGNRGVEWLSAAASANVTSRTPYHARKQINFHANMPFEASPEASAFWSELKACFLRDSWFESLIQRKYEDYFRLRFGDLAEAPNFLSHFRKELFLQRHEPGYSIGPHTDIPTRVFTCIFSFASVPGFEDFGTQLLAHQDPLVRCWGNDHYAPEGFVVKKLAPYKPNNFLLFFKTRQSFHSVKTVTGDVPNQRYGMQFQFYEPGKGLFKDLSAPDLLSTRHKPAVQKPQLISWVATSPTHLKRSTDAALSLADEDKRAVNPGDTLSCTKSTPVGIHVALSDATLQGQQIGSGWFIFPAHWQTQQMEEKRLLADAH